MENKDLKMLYVAASGDRKTGPMSAIYTDASTCPTRCPFKGNGCYASYGHCRMAWARASVPPEDLASVVRQKGLLDIVRINIAGDLAKPGTSDIDKELVQLFIQTFCRDGITVYTYTHCAPTSRNKEIVREAIAKGFCMSFSCEDKETALQLHAEGLPVVLATAEECEGPGWFHCKGGTDGTTCRTCKVCMKADRKVIPVFQLHGPGRKKAAKAIAAKED